MVIQQPVEGVQRRPGPLSLEDSNLLSKREHFQCSGSAAAKEDTDGGEESQTEMEHDATVVTPRSRTWGSCVPGIVTC